MGCSVPLSHERLAFCWMGSQPIPAMLDLRNLGWKMLAGSTCQRGRTAICPSLIELDWHSPDEADAMLDAIHISDRRRVVVTGVSHPRQRMDLLRLGFGDAIDRSASLEEVAIRMERVVRSTDWLPRYRHLGMVRLDLIARDAFIQDTALNLNPREFALLWRLADEPRKAVNKQALIQDVWRMGFVPETNSVAVHMSRLRRKLHIAGIADMIETVQDNGYRLNQDVAEGTTPLDVPRPVKALPCSPACRTVQGETCLPSEVFS